MSYLNLIKPFSISLSLLSLVFVAHVSADTNYAKNRQTLVQEIEQTVQETASYIGFSELDARVMQAILKVPRHRYVPRKYWGAAYENRPLPIGHGQTISQPYIVALMTDLLSVKPTDKVLEIGTGSGYQAAILAELSNQVYTIEIIDALSKRASKVLDQQGYRNVTTRIGDGYYGWQSQAPFDVIVVTAAASHVPPPLIKQLKPGGRMVIPVGSRFMVQQLVLITKDDKGKISTRQILPVRFVPLTGDHD